MTVNIVQWRVVVIVLAWLGFLSVHVWGYSDIYIYIYIYLFIYLERERERRQFCGRSFGADLWNSY